MLGQSPLGFQSLVKITNNQNHKQKSGIKNEINFYFGKIFIKPYLKLIFITRKFRYNDELFLTRFKTEMDLNEMDLSLVFLVYCAEYIYSKKSVTAFDITLFLTLRLLVA